MSKSARLNNASGTKTDRQGEAVQNRHTQPAISAECPPRTESPENASDSQDCICCNKEGLLDSHLNNKPRAKRIKVVVRRPLPTVLSAVWSWESASCSRRGLCPSQCREACHAEANALSPGCDQESSPHQDGRFRVDNARCQPPSVSSTRFQCSS